MEQDYNIKHWAKPCPKYDCRKDSCKCGVRFVSIPAVLGDDSSESDVAPKNGLYCNTIVRYEANGNVYLYSKEGIPVLVEYVEQPNEPIHLSIKNASTATWQQMGKEDERSAEAGWDKGAAMSSDVIFQTDDGQEITVEELYNAVAKGQKFTIDVPFRDIAAAASLWDFPVSLDTAKAIEFNTQVNEMPIFGPQYSAMTVYASSAVVMCQGPGFDVVPYVLPFGVFKRNNNYMFFATIMGYDPN